MNDAGTEGELAAPAAARRRWSLRALLSPGDGPPLRQITAYGGTYPLVIISTLNVVDELDRAVVAVFGPNLKRYFGIDNATLGALVGVQVLAIVVLAVPFGYLGTKYDRAKILRWSAAAWSVCSLATSLAVRLPLFFLARFGVGVGKSSVEPVGRSLLTDYYPPNGWNRVLAIHGAANPIGSLLGPAIAGTLALFVAGDDIWRWAFPILTVPSIVALVWARKLREPENQMVRGLTGSVLTVTGAPSGLSFRESVMRLVTIPTLKRQLVGIGILGFGLVGLLTFFNIFLEEQYGVGEGGRSIIAMIIATASLLGTLVGGNVGERVFEASPVRAVRMVGASIAGFSLFLGGAVCLPNVYVFVPVAWLGVLALAIGAAPLYAALSAISPPRLRPLMFALLGVFIAVFGGISGGVIVGVIADATNIQIGMASLAPTGVIGGLLMLRGGATIEADIARVAKESEGDPLAAFLS